MLNALQHSLCEINRKKEKKYIDIVQCDSQRGLVLTEKLTKFDGLVVSQFREEEKRQNKTESNPKVTCSNYVENRAALCRCISLNNVVTAHLPKGFHQNGT